MPTHDGLLTLPEFAEQADKRINGALDKLLDAMNLQPKEREETRLELLRPFCERMDRIGQAMFHSQIPPRRD